MFWPEWSGSVGIGEFIWKLCNCGNGDQSHTWTMEPLEPYKDLDFRFWSICWSTEPLSVVWLQCQAPDSWTFSCSQGQFKLHLSCSTKSKGSRLGLGSKRECDILSLKYNFFVAQAVLGSNIMIFLGSNIFMEKQYQPRWAQRLLLYLNQFRSWNGDKKS